MVGVFAIRPIYKEEKSQKKIRGKRKRERKKKKEKKKRKKRKKKEEKGKKRNYIKTTKDNTNKTFKPLAAMKK